jgi:predicted DNA-binding transcriptional regulator AlpA
MNNTETKSNKSEVKDLLHKFDALPDAAHVRFEEVKTLLACSRTTAYRLIKSGALKPKKFSTRAVAFNVGDLRELIAKSQINKAHVIEHQLAHKVPDALGVAYNRTKFIDQRSLMM